jgi:hypothetical protein
MGRIPPGLWRDAPGEFLKSGGLDGEKKDVMLLRNGKRIIVKVKAGKVSKKKTGIRQTRFPAGMTPNKPHNVNIRESKHLIRSPRRGSVPKPTAD